MRFIRYLYDKCFHLSTYLPIYARKNSLRTPDLFDKIAFLTYNFSIIQTERIQGEKIFYEHTRNVRFKRL